MIGNLLRVTNDELEEYLKDSSLLELRVSDTELDEILGNFITVDKAWDGIIFLLTGEGFGISDDPLSGVFFSGQLIDEYQDMGYGPANYSTSSQVKELSNQISTMTVGEISKKYDPKKMEELEIYPAVWSVADYKVNLDYLLSKFGMVQKFYSEAAKNDEAVITFLD